MIISDDDVFRTKPHPEPYATAAKALGADPARCVAFEDSATGSQSALSAGCFVVVVSDQPELGAPQLDGSGFAADDRLTVLRPLEGTSVRDLID